mmetsp:Transcript_17643/g.47956  ORF Transcript_17643/g.47956 Transcript_17643/m.47956 type:complete len:226 (-) Transcript_17643:181-858(-)
MPARALLLLLALAFALALAPVEVLCSIQRLVAELADALLQIEHALGVVAQGVGAEVAAVFRRDRREQRCLAEAYAVAAREEHRPQVPLELGALELRGVVVEHPADAQRHQLEGLPDLGVQLPEVLVVELRGSVVGVGRAGVRELHELAAEARLVDRARATANLHGVAVLHVVGRGEDEALHARALGRLVRMVRRDDVGAEDVLEARRRRALSGQMEDVGAPLEDA